MRVKTCAAGLLILLMSAIGALAQTTTVKGTIKDAQGQPMQGVVVQLHDIDTGRKFTLKSDKKGQIFSIGIAPGKFDVTATKDGKLIYTGKFQAGMDEDKNILDINLAEATRQAAPGAQAGQQPPPSTKGLTEEQKKQLEEIEKKNAEITKENAKIGGLNALLKEAQADMQANNYAQAVTVMQQAAQQDNGQHDQVYGVLGSALLGDGNAQEKAHNKDAATKDYTEAADAYNKAIQLGSAQPATANVKPRIASYYVNMGQALAKSGKTNEAIDAYNKAAEEDPAQAAQAYYNEGAVLTNSGKADEANAAFDKAIAANPNDANAYYQKGVNLFGKSTADKSGKLIPPPGTVDALNKYLELQPDGPNAEAAKQILESLGAKVTTSFKKK